MTNEPDKLDDLITRAARDYNAPSDVPREEIWNRIAEARRAEEAVSRSTRRTAPLVWSIAGLAAAGLVAVGVAIGRYVERARGTASERATQTAKAIDTTPIRTPGRSGAPSVAEVADSHPAAPTARIGGGRPGSVPNGDGSAIAYRLAVVDHIAGSEAMITAFRGAARRGEIDPQIATWSRDLLGETRLLERSAPADDVEMKRLLEDLELVLAQIVQYTNHGAHSADDLDLIERSIKRRAVMTNIRTMSAGRLPSGT